MRKFRFPFGPHVSLNQNTLVLGIAFLPFLPHILQGFAQWNAGEAMAAATGGEGFDLEAPREEGPTADLITLALEGLIPVRRSTREGGGNVR